MKTEKTTCENLNPGDLIVPYPGRLYATARDVWFVVGCVEKGDMITMSLIEIPTEHPQVFILRQAKRALEFRIVL